MTTNETAPPVIVKFAGTVSEQELAAFRSALEDALRASPMIRRVASPMIRRVAILETVLGEVLALYDDPIGSAMMIRTGWTDPAKVLQWRAVLGQVTS